MNRAAWLVVTGCVAVTSASVAMWTRPKKAPAAAVFGPSTTLAYVSSAACLPCHSSEHASFNRTWHRTMTQAATNSTVLAPFERRGDEVWHDGKRVVLTTGSHREQAYWTQGERGALEILPVVWLPREGVLIPRSEAFIVPPNEPMPVVRWGSSCIACHAVAGEPHRDAANDTWDTRVAEVGIACEACHGPGAAHVEQYRDPVARYVKQVDRKIIQPAKLSPERANAVCGQCHAYAYPKDEASWWKDGYAKTFRAGDALTASRTLLRVDAMNGQNGAPDIDAPASAIFWPDGDVRVGGREYNGLVGSKCKATCVNCHSMHGGDPAGQLAPDRDCTTSCHTSERARNHSKHTALVTCADCHMPKTSFALLQGVRSHRIAIPRASETKPSACNLCHLDKPAAAPYGISAGLGGDAGVRALIADSLATSRNPSFAASLLDVMKNDPYAAVRFIAARSRRRFPIAVAPLPAAVTEPIISQRDNRPVTIAE